MDAGDDPATGDQWECPYDGPNECGNYEDISASACEKFIEHSKPRKFTLLGNMKIVFQNDCNQI